MEVRRFIHYNEYEKFLKFACFYDIASETKTKDNLRAAEAARKICKIKNKGVVSIYINTNTITITLDTDK